MGKFLDYNPDQAYLLPPSVHDVLGPGHLCFFLRRVVAKLNLRAFREEYGEEGGPAYAPEMLISVWLYAYALNVTSSRRFGAAHSRRFGISLFGGRRDAGSLDAKCVSSATWQGIERFVHPGGGAGARQRFGPPGTRGCRLHAHRGQCFAESD